MTLSSQNAPAPESGGERLHALDAVRAGCLLLGIVLHAAMSFIPGAPYWVARDMDANDTMAATFFTIHTFRMTTFFVIAGLFGRMMFVRLGAGSFAKDRARRILLPLVVGWLTIMPLFTLAAHWALTESYGPEIFDTPFGQPAPFTPRMIPLQHFWFLYQLVWLYIATLAVTWAVGRIDRKGLAARAADLVFRRLTLSPFAAVILALPATLALMATPNWTMWTGILAPDKGFFLNLTGPVCYGMAFLVGWTLHRQMGLLDVLKRWWAPNLAAGIVLTWWCLSQSGHEPDLAPAEQGLGKLAHAYAYALAGWTWTLGVIGGAMTFLSRYSPVRRYLADASYWLYLTHMPLVIALQGLVARHDAPWPLKVVFILGVTVAVLLASYQLFVRGTVIGAVLNGRKRGALEPAEKRKPAAAESPARTA